MRRFRRKIELYPDIYSANGVGPVRTIREFDEQITARYSGFSGADDYYFRASSARVLARIGIPTLVLHSTDDPFIRMTPVSRRALSDNPNVRLIETHHGGHCAFLSKKSVAPASKSGSFSDTGRGNRHWAEATLVRFLMANIGHADGS
jgi:predicted alpha/beta-fold hydrolase